MGLIDSHAHLTYPDFAARIGEVLELCEQAGVERIITVGTSLDDARAAIALAHAHPKKIHAAIGFHPHGADDVSDKDLAAMAELWRDPQVVACGEMGLDFHYDFADVKKQRHIFSRQLELAVNIHKPLIIHARESIDDCIAMLVDHGFEGHRVVFHCFTGTETEAQKIAARGWRISFTGIVTFPKSHELHKIARDYPAHQLMIETDAPYLSPVPVRSKKPCEPAYVAHTASFLADLRGIDRNELVEQTRRNTMEFFALPE